MKTNHAVYWAMSGAVERAGDVAMSGDVEWVEYRGLRWAMWQAVYNAMEGAVYWAARGNPPHPALRDFLSAAEVS